MTFPYQKIAALGKGKTVDEPQTDYNGNIFLATRSIGAYEGN